MNESRPEMDSVFLDPVYINEKMILNCAAYLFSGIPTESTSTQSNLREKEGGFSLRIPFLSEFLGLPEAGASISSTSSEQNVVARRFTVGGLHMVVLDELAKKNMIVNWDGGNYQRKVSRGAAYLEIECILEESDYSSYLGTLKVLSPLVAQLLKDYGERLVPEGPAWMKDKKRRDTVISSYEASVTSIIRQLEDDSLASRQVEMVMWTPDKERALGVVDLDLGEVEATELRTKLNGGRYTIIGKVTRSVEEGGSIDLLEKTTFSRAISLAEKLSSLQTGGQNVRMNQLLRSLRQGNDLIRLQLPGPAIRISAMSVCI